MLERIIEVPEVLYSTFEQCSRKMNAPSLIKKHFHIHTTFIWLCIVCQLVTGFTNKGTIIMFLWPYRSGLWTFWNLNWSSEIFTQPKQMHHFYNDFKGYLQQNVSKDVCFRTRVKCCFFSYLLHLHTQFDAYAAVNKH